MFVFIDTFVCSNMDMDDDNCVFSDFEQENPFAKANESAEEDEPHSPPPPLSRSLALAGYEYILPSTATTFTVQRSGLGPLTLFTSREAAADYASYHGNECLLKTGITSSSWFSVANQAHLAQLLIAARNLNRLNNKPPYYEFLEILQPSTSVRLFLDIEGFFYNQEQGNVIVERVLSQVENVIRSGHFVPKSTVDWAQIKVEDLPNRIAWQNHRKNDNNGMMKVSYHVIYPNMIFKNIKHLQRFVVGELYPLVSKEVDVNEKCVLDKLVYGENRCFRLPLMHKDSTSGSFELSEYFTLPVIPFEPVAVKNSIVVTPNWNLLPIVYEEPPQGVDVVFPSPQGDHVLSICLLERMVTVEESELFELHFDYWCKRLGAIPATVNNAPCLEGQHIYVDCTPTSYCPVSHKHHSLDNCIPKKRKIQYDLDTLVSLVNCAVCGSSTPGVYYDHHTSTFVDFDKRDHKHGEFSFKSSLSKEGEQLVVRLARELYHVAKVGDDSFYSYERSLSLWKLGMNGRDERWFYVDFLVRKLKACCARSKAFKDGQAVKFFTDKLDAVNNRQQVNTRHAKLSMKFLQDSEVASKMDRNEFLVPVRDCRVIDLRSGVSRKREKGDFFTEFVDIAYLSSDLIAPRVKVVDDFMRSVLFQPDWYDPFRAMLGYLMFGNVKRERAFFVWIGDGRNGKSVITELVELVLRNSFMYFQMSKAFLIQQNFNSQEGHSTSLMELKSARVIAVAELDAADRMDGSKIKSLVGGDVVRGRSAYAKSTKTFEPLFKIVMHTNRMPELNSSDQAIRDRMLSVSFENRFEASDVELLTARQKRADTELVQRIKADKEAVLSWFVNQAKFYWSLVEQDKSLRDIWPAEWKLATSEHLDENHAEGFLQNMLVLDRDLPVKSFMSTQMFTWLQDEYMISFMGVRMPTRDDRKEFRQTLSMATVLDAHGIPFPKIKTATYRYKGKMVRALGKYIPSPQWVEKVKTSPIVYSPYTVEESDNFELVKQRVANGLSQRVE